MGGTSAVPSHPLIHGIGRPGVGDGSWVSCVLSFVNLRGGVYFLLGQAWAEGKGGARNEPLPRGLRTGKLGKMYTAMIYIG